MVVVVVALLLLLVLDVFRNVCCVGVVSMREARCRGRQINGCCCGAGVGVAVVVVVVVAGYELGFALLEL